MIDCVIKLGGSAVSDKNHLETPRLEEISSATELVLQLIQNGLKCVIVHGAGSFGHHQAKAYQVNGGLTEEDSERTRVGFCLTRRSVLKLQQIIVDSFIEASIPAVAQSPCGYWVTDSGQVVEDNVNGLQQLVNAGFVPVIHGDCVLDRSKGCAILSGDTIIKVICKKMLVSRVVFLTDVDGIYTHPPETPDSELIPSIEVTPGGNVDLKISSNTNKHDVTGGIMLKINTAVDIVQMTRGETRVFVCRVNSESAHHACFSGKLDSSGGTMITCENQ